MAAATFFDMDLTLIAVNSGTAWVRHLRRKGELTRWGMVKALSWIARYKLALIDLAKLTEMLVEDQAGNPEQALRDECAAWVEREIAPHVYPAARDAIADHRARGHAIALLTSSSPYASEPVAATVGIEPADVLCTRLVVADGKFTGKVVQPVCASAGKITWAERWAASRGVDLAQSWFYTDSYNDLPMMERVGHPVAIHPDVRLRRHARKRGWPIVYWGDPQAAKRRPA